MFDWFGVELAYNYLGTATLEGNNGDTYVSDGVTYTFTANNIKLDVKGHAVGLGPVLYFL